MRNGATRSIVKFMALILLITLAVLIARYFGLNAFVEGGSLRAYIEGFGPWAPAAYIAVYVLIACLMFPALPITILGGVLFGPLWGTIYVSIGATLGAAAAFLIARYLGRDLVEGMLVGGRLRELYRRTGEEGWKIVAFTRLVPVFPYNFLNYAFGLTRIGFVAYVAASFIFMLPGVVAYVFFSSSLLDLLHGDLPASFFVGLAMIILLTLIPLFLSRHGYWRHRP